LTYLDISSTPVTDLQPLADLHRLHDLMAQHTHVTSIPIPSLTTLNLFGTRLRSLAMVTSLPNLTHAMLGPAPTVDTLEPLTRLTKLVDLSIHRFEAVTDLSPLVDLPNLKALCVANTPVTDVACLTTLPKLSTFSTRGTEVCSFAALNSTMKQVRHDTWVRKRLPPV